MYIVNSMNKWAEKWYNNNWKKSSKSTIENLELIKKLYFYKNNFKITFNHIKSHTKKPDINSQEYFYWYGNYMADKLASSASSS